MEPDYNRQEHYHRHGIVGIIYAFMIAFYNQRFPYSIDQSQSL